MARSKLTPMEFRRKYCKHAPRFAPEEVTPAPVSIQVPKAAPVITKVA